MPGTNPVGTYTDPNFETQTGTEYKTNLDNAHRVGKRFADAFAVHAKTTPDMNVLVDAGFILSNLTLIEQAQQTISSIAAPSTNPRIDRIVIDQITGVASRIAGTEGVSPSAPALTANKAPCARIALTVGQTSITNAAITDERVPLGVGRASAQATFAVALGNGNGGNRFQSWGVISNTINAITVRVEVRVVTNSGSKGSGNVISYVRQEYTVTHDLGRIQQVTPVMVITTEDATSATGTLQVNYL